LIFAKKEINGKSGYFFVQKGSNYRERKKIVVQFAKTSLGENL